MKKSIFSRIGALLMSMILLLSTFAFAAFADEPTTEPKQPTISALPNTKLPVSLTIHKYDGDIKTDKDGNMIHTTGNVLNTGDLPDGVKPVGGVQFTIVKVEEVPAGTQDSFIVNDIEAMPHSYKPVTSGALTKQDKTAEEGDNKGIVTFSNLPQGIYYVTESNAAETGRSPIQPFVVELPMTNPEYVNKDNADVSGEAWIYDVHVYPKNQPLPFDKSVEEIGNHSSNNYIGQIQKWIINSVIPRDLVKATTAAANPEATNKVQTYTITDYMDPRLTFVDTVAANATPEKYQNATLTVNIFNKYGDSNQVPTKTAYDPLVDDYVEGKAFSILLNKDSDYELSVTTVKSTDEDTHNGAFVGRTRILISLTASGFNKVGKLLGAVGGVEGSPDLYIGVNIYSFINDKILSQDVATVQGDTEKYLGEDIPNDAVLNFKNQYTSDKDTGVEIKSPTSKVHTGGMSILKVDKNTPSKILEGATFAIASSLDNAKAGYFLQKYKVKENDKEIITIIDKDDPGYVKDVWNPELNTVKNTEAYDAIYTSTSDSNGLAGFYGLEYGAKVIKCTGATSGCKDNDNDGTYDEHLNGCPFAEGNLAKDDSAEKTYYIVELKAPLIQEQVTNEKGENVGVTTTTKHYNLLDAPVPVTVNATSHLNDNKITVENSAGFKLPTTGGIGTTILTVAGSVLMVTAAVFFFVLKKKSKKSDKTVG